MNINAFINKIGLLKSEIHHNGEFNKPEFDSRKIVKGDLFVAITGTVTDGHQYIYAVAEKGAGVIVCERLPEELIANVSYLLVKSSSYALGVIASEFYGNPSSKIKLIGVTGTNGKTTIASTLFNLTRKMGYKAGLISTIEVIIENKSIPATHTTPDPLQTNKYLSEMLESACDYCYMEVSSHATIQNRIAGLSFVAGAFTNITHDHLDFHHSFREYIKAKQLFFEALPENSVALTNADDKNGFVMVQNSKAKTLSYSLRTASDFKAKILESGFEGMLLRIDNDEVWTKYTGKFNAYNLLCVFGITQILGFDKNEVLMQLSSLNPIEGRFETILSENRITGIVDYAHTPDALKNVLETINNIRQGEGELITVVGAGGDRDKTKRSEMAKIAVEQSDKLILTSDNPRTEDPESILDDMQQGVNIVQQKKTLRITNRAEAIRTACFMAKPGDVILVAGKGHEKYQEINGVRHHFDDKEILVETFKQLQ